MLDIIQPEGVDLHHVVTSHTGGPSPQEMGAIFKRGAHVEWDFMGRPR